MSCIYDKSETFQTTLVDYIKVVCWKVEYGILIKRNVISLGKDWDDNVKLHVQEEMRTYPQTLASKIKMKEQPSGRRSNKKIRSKFKKKL